MFGTPIIIFAACPRYFPAFESVSNYDNYVEHMRITHPDQTPMTYEEFFRERQDARYGGKGGARCC